MVQGKGLALLFAGFLNVTHFIPEGTTLCLKELQNEKRKLKIAKA